MFLKSLYKSNFNKPKVFYVQKLSMKKFCSEYKNKNPRISRIFHHLIQKVLLNSTAEERLDRSGKTGTGNMDGVQRGIRQKNAVLVFFPS